MAIFRVTLKNVKIFHSLWKKVTSCEKKSQVVKKSHSCEKNSQTLIFKINIPLPIIELYLHAFNKIILKKFVKNFHCCDFLSRICDFPPNPDYELSLPSTLITATRYGLSLQNPLVTACQGRARISKMGEGEIINNFFQFFMKKFNF